MLKKELYFWIFLGFIILGSWVNAIVGQEKKCIDGKIHSLSTDKYWKGTGFSCKPLSSEETLDAT